MKLQVKLALYNTLTKVAIILFTGLFILLIVEKVTYGHIERRLEEDKNQIINNLSAGEMDSFVTGQQSHIRYSVLKEEYIAVIPVSYQENISAATTFSTEKRKTGRGLESYRVLHYQFNFKKHTYRLEIGETLDAIEDLKTTIKRFALVVLVVSLALTLISDLLFTKYLLAPLYQIIDRKLIKVNDPMTFDYNKVQTTTQDFALLDDSISSLMKKVNELFALEKQFIANVSHELLTPISIISSRLENVLLHEQLTEEGENKMHGVLITLNRLKSIINSLLLISRVENNHFHKNETVMIAGIVKDTYEELEDRVAEKKLTFINDIKYIYSIPGNGPLMHTLIYNLINNAIKYNVERGTIRVSDKLDENVYELSITDTGIGMDAPEIEKVFNRFEKLATDERESHGLGLAIVKSITSFHHIRVQIQSAKKQGTTVKLVFDNPDKFI